MWTILRKPRNSESKMPFPGRKTAPKSIMEAKVYHPTMEEFADFAQFIDKIEREDEAHKIGICKVVPPKEWIPRKKGYNLDDLNYVIEGKKKQGHILVNFLTKLSVIAC